MNLRDLLVFPLLLIPVLEAADHESELAAFRASQPVLADKYELLQPTFADLEVRHKKETRDQVLAALDSVARKSVDATQRTEVERQFRSWKAILDADLETVRELQKLVGPREVLFIFRFVNGLMVESGYLTLSEGKIVQRHVLTRGEDFWRSWPEHKTQEFQRTGDSLPPQE
ncbi:MAG: hypothetical protein ACREIA_20390 [Opitutaceae bacterium]